MLPLGALQPLDVGTGLVFPHLLQGAPTHPSALYWLVPGMPAPCCTVTGLKVVATFRAFMAFSFLL